MNIKTVRFSVFESAVLLALLVPAWPVGNCQTQGWQSLSLDFSPEVLLSHGDAMWAAGSAQTIALSTDAGRTWTHKYQKQGGGVLLTLGFVTDKFGYASGTGLDVLMTEDGGNTWAPRVTVPEAVLQSAFGDPEHGIIRVRAKLLATTDGGKTWNPVVPSNDPNWTDKCNHTITLTALDAKHLLARVEGPNTGEYLYTTDGGATWTAVVLESAAGAKGAFVVGGKYWSIGMEVVDKTDGRGGHSTPMAVASPDGSRWEHLLVYHDVCHWRLCSNCTWQGCFASGTSFVPFSRILDDAAGNHSTPPGTSPEPLARFPRHMLSDQWARSGDSLCLLTGELIECTTLSLVTALDTHDDSAEEQDARSYPPFSADPRVNRFEPSIEPELPSGTHCIRCNLTLFYISMSASKSGPVDFDLKFEIGPGGRATNVELSSYLPPDAASEMRKIIATWLFEPLIKDGKESTVSVHLRGKVQILGANIPSRVQ